MGNWGLLKKKKKNYPQNSDHRLMVMFNLVKNLEQSAGLYIKDKTTSRFSRMLLMNGGLRPNICRRFVGSHLPWKLAPPLPVLQIHYWQPFIAMEEMSV